MDAKSFGKLTRGKLRPEGRIDLHGMTMAEAHPALQDFILGIRAIAAPIGSCDYGQGQIQARLWAHSGTSWGIEA